MTTTTTISDDDERRTNLAMKHLATIEQIHHPRDEEVLPMDCAEGECEHDEAARGEECPTVTMTVCAECWGLVYEMDPEHYVPSAVQWPCTTAKGFGASA